MKTLEEQLQTAGLTVVGHCKNLSAYSVELSRTSPLLLDMTAQEADLLGQSMLMVRAEPGQALIREGEVGEWMLLILKGTVDVTKQVPQTAEQRAEDAGKGIEDGEDDAGAGGAEKTVISRIAVIQYGATLGEMSMLDSEPRYATCTAIEAVEAGVLGRHEIAVLIRDHPAVGAKLLVKITQLMAQRLRNTTNQLVKLLQK